MNTSTSTQTHEFDVVVVGSGNGGLTAAIVAAHHGLDVVVIEKAAHFGGSSALSGGAVWIPNNPVNERAGVEDSPADAWDYLEAVVGDRVPESRRSAFLRYGPETIGFLERNTEHIRYAYTPGYPDYHPEAPGGSAAGRSIVPLPIDARRLGEQTDQLNRSDVLEPPGGMWLRPAEYRDLLLLTRTWRGRMTALRVGFRTAIARAARRKIVSSGAAGVVRLILALREQNVPLWLETPLTDLVVENERVVGVVAEQDGSPVTIRARKGVILAAGGFERNEEMRQRFQQEPIRGTWTSGANTNTGDAIRAGMEIGADTDLMDRAWWGPSLLSGERGIFILSERSMPGSLMVDGNGKRFTNESAPYVNVVDAMYEAHKRDEAAIPSYLILDQRFRNRYPFVKTPPRRKLPREWFENGTVVSAPSLEALAEAVGLPAKELVATVRQFNEFADRGRDEDFGRGESAYDRYYGDETVTPNPNLAPLVKSPYYAFRLVPGDLGTSGGLRCDERARVLTSDGSVIDGLFAVGNSSAAVMGEEYAGPGATIGPAMVFGYLAALELAGAQVTAS